MRFGVLGPLAVWTDEGALVRIPAVKVRAVLADLLLSPGKLVSADQLMDDLWGDALPADPAGALQSKVSQLRRALEQAEPGGRELIVRRAGGYVLQAPPESVDRTRFEALASRARRLLEAEPRAALGLLDEALALWRGPALADFADHAFARPAIVELEEARLAALEDRVEARLALGAHGQLVSELDRLVREHPLRERFRGQHMRALYRAGRQADALASFQELRTRLAEDLGVDPGAHVSRLFHAILNQDASLDAPAAARHDRPRTNLPASRTTLVGREAAVQRIRHLLADSRLVMLTGSGGVGKTRLALETAAAVLDEFAHGVWVVELTANEQPESGDPMTWVVEQVAAVLGVQDDAICAREHPVLPRRIAAALEHQSVLLVLDNCDHVVRPVATLADELLRAAPRLRILATSRRPLELTGEQLWSVPPLTVPDTTSTDPDDLLRFDAVRLFAERAAAADPEFAVTAVNAAAVAEVCRRLDGLPLALELAAARIRALPVEALAARFDDRFRLLTTNVADAPPRQQTLGALIDWSWEQLSPSERTVLRRLSVFANAAPLQAAEAVCAGDGVDAPEVLGRIVSLVDHSLVAVEHAGDGRYRMLETIRSYGRQRLAESGEADRTHLRHARYHTELAEAGDEQLRGPDQRAWLDRFDAAAADARAAVEWALAHDASLALRLVGAMAWYWYLRGRQGEAGRLLARALEQAGGDAPAAAHARGLAWLGALGSLEQPAFDPAADRGAALPAQVERLDPVGAAHAKLLLGGLLRPWAEVAGGGELIEDALEAARRTGGRWVVAAALSVRGWLALGRGELDAARRDGEEAGALFTELGDCWGQARSAELRGQVAEILGDYVRAEQLHRSALEAAEALGLWAAAAQALSRLGRLATLVGDHAAARALHQRALRLTRELALEQGIVFARVGLGLTARREGSLDEAEQHFRAVLDWHVDRDFHSGTALCLAELGFVAELRGDAAQARELHRRSLDAADRSGEPRARALALEGLAGAAAAEGNATEAATLLGAAAAVREAAGGQLPSAERGDVDRIAASATAELGADGYAAAFKAGRAVDRAQDLLSML